MKREELKPESLYRLTKDVTNPFGDKRKTRGTLRDLPTIPAGTFFRPEGWREVYANLALTTGAALNRERMEKQILQDSKCVAVLGNGDPYQRLWLIPMQGEADAKNAQRSKALAHALLSNLEEVSETFAFWLLEERISDQQVREALISAVESGRLDSGAAKNLILEYVTKPEASPPMPLLTPH
jgi:hypothetical protein